MKQAEITKLSVKDLQGKLAELSDRLVRMKLTHGVSPIENPIQIKDLRKTVARLNTELTKREAQA